MTPVEEFFKVKTPTLESVLSLKGEDPADLSLNLRIKKYLEIYKAMPDDFYEDHYEFADRTIRLATWFSDPTPFEDIFEFYVELCQEDDEVLLCSCENYLEKVISRSKNNSLQDFLLGKWRQLNKAYDQDEFLVVEVLSLLLESGFATEEVERAVCQVLWGRDPLLKGLISSRIDNLPSSQKELKRRVKFIAPLVHYGPKERFINPYFDEWCELSEPYMKFIKGIDIDDYYKENSISRSEDDEFLVNVLGVQDDRVRRLNQKYLYGKASHESEKIYKEVRKVIEKNMDQEFFSKLPSSPEEWLSNPFIEPHQKQEFLDFVASLDEEDYL